MFKYPSKNYRVSFGVKEMFQLTQWFYFFFPLIVFIFLVWPVNWKINYLQISTAETVFHSSSSKWLATVNITNSKTYERKACIATQCTWSSSCLRRVSGMEAGVVGAPFWGFFFSSVCQIFNTLGGFFSFFSFFSETKRDYMKQYCV